MKYIKKFENKKYEIGTYVRLSNNNILYSTICRINKCTLETIFRINSYSKYQNNGDLSDAPYCINILNHDDPIEYMWVNENDIIPLTEQEITTNKYNL